MLAPLTGKGLQSEQLATARLNVWEGAVRSSKTVSSVMAWLKFVRTAPAGNLLMVGRTERTLKRNIIDPLIEMLGTRRCRFVAGSGELWLLGRRVYVAGANDEAAQTKIQGLSLLGAYVDEISTIPESFFKMLLTRLSEEDARLFGTSNPDSARHWFKVGFLDRFGLHLTGDGRLVEGRGDVLDLRRFSFRLEDNSHLPKAYVAALKAEFVGLWYKRFILGEWVIAEGAVYDMFDPDEHVVDQLPPMERWLGVGIDHGSAHPSAALLLGVGTASDGRRRLYLAAEWRDDTAGNGRSLTVAEVSDRIRDWETSLQWPGFPGRTVRAERFFVDSAARTLRVQMHQDWATPERTDKSVIDGIRTFGSLLAGDQLKIHASCTGLLDEIPGYTWDKRAAARGEDSPDKGKGHDDSLDAGRYVIYNTRSVWRALLSPRQTAIPSGRRA